VLRELRPQDPRLIGPYRLVGQLGDGGMGRVYLGRSAGGRPVAVKVIRSDLAADPDFRARFRREVSAARRVNGLFTAMVVDADVDAPEPWLATAYVAGPSLAEAVRERGPLPVNSVLALAAGLAESLAAIHAAGVVHRDLKPSNVLLGPDGPCVIDFGISRAVEQTSLTRVGFVIGSPGFMSPEQAEGHEVGPASDIFSLGAVLAFAAIADSPFGSGSTAALVYRIVYAAPNLGGVPDEIRPLLERCLAKDPAQRPTASELLAEVEAAEPEAGWLPEPFTSMFPGGQAQSAERPTPPMVAEPADADLTVTGESAPVVPRPGAASGEAEAAVPDLAAEAASLAAEAAASDLAGQAVPAEAAAAAAAALAVASEAETVLPKAETVPPAAETVPPGAEAAAAESETAAPSSDAVDLESSTIPPVGEATSAEAETVAKAIPLAAAVPLAGEDPLRKPRRRPVRSIALASAAAVLVIASVGIGLALTGSKHPSSSHQGALVAASSTSAASQAASPAAQPATAQKSASAPRTSPHSTARSSQRPAAQPTTQAATTQVPTTAPSTVKSTPKPTPKPSPKPTPRSTALSVSVSGGSEDSCADVGALHSSAGASVEYSFSDQSSANIAIAVIDASGAETQEVTMSPGGNYTAGTSVGTYWVVENSGGGCLAVVDVGGSGQATIT
jgi:eukaryotic-like serine/threonine-protein kinase